MKIALRPTRINNSLRINIRTTTQDREIAHDVRTGAKDQGRSEETSRTAASSSAPTGGPGQKRGESGAAYLARGRDTGTRQGY